MKLRGEPQAVYERFKEPRPVPLPLGTIEHAHPDDDTLPDTFGVREILETSNDGTVLVLYGHHNLGPDDIRVRLPANKVTAEALNEIRGFVREFLEARAQHESVPEIMQPVQELTESLRKLTRARMEDATEGDINLRDIRSTIEQLGILTEDLQKGGPRTLKDIMQYLKNLRRLGVIYFMAGMNTVQVEANFYHYLGKLEALETA